MENVLHDYNYCYYGKVQIISLYYRLYMGYSRDVPLNHPPSSHLCPIRYIGYYGHLYIPWDPNRTLISPPPQVKSFKGVNLMTFIVWGGYQQLTLAITLISYVLLFAASPSCSFQITHLPFLSTITTGDCSSCTLVAIKECLEIKFPQRHGSTSKDMPQHFTVHQLWRRVFMTFIFSSSFYA